MNTSFNNFLFTTSLLMLFMFNCGTELVESKFNSNIEITDEQIDNRNSILCYQTGTKIFDEIIQLRIINNKINGEGIRVYSKSSLTYKFHFDGVINKNIAEISIQGSNTRKPTDTFLNSETWIITENELIVNKRNSKSIKGNFKFYRINCNFLGESDSTRFDSFNGFYEGYAVVSKNGKYGLIDDQWQVTIPIEFKDLGVVNEGSIVYYDEHSGFSGLLDVNGNVIVEAKYSEIHCFNNGLAAFLSNDGKWGFMDTNFQIVIKPKFLNINFYKPDPHRHPFNEGLANVQTQNNKWNFINNKGTIVIAGNFLFAKSFINGKAEVYKDNKWYKIDKSGKCINNCD